MQSRPFPIDGIDSISVMWKTDLLESDLKLEPGICLSLEALNEVSGIRALRRAYGSMLRQCGNASSLSEGKLVHTHIRKHGHDGDTFIGNLLMQMYGKCGDLEEVLVVFERIDRQNVFSWNIIITAYAQNGHLEEAKRLFDEMPQRDVVSWTAMIAGYAQSGHGKDALELFRLMEPVEPNKVTFLSVLEVCAGPGDLAEGKFLHCKLNNSGLGADVALETAVVKMYISCRSLDNARIIFDRMPERNLLSWTTMIAAYAQDGDLQYARSMFEQMPHRDIISWNTMIAGYSQHGDHEGARNLFEQMPNRDVVSWTTMITAYAQAGDMDGAQEMFSRMPHKDVVSWNAMIAAYAQNGDLQSAREMFDKLPRRNVVSWNAIIAANAQNGDCIEALRLFCLMDLEGVHPNKSTLLSVIDACTTLLSLDRGKAVHQSLADCEFEWDEEFDTALLSFYGKCGSLDNALKIFNEMPKLGVVSWSAMVATYAQNGHCKEALNLFQMMQLEGVEPTEVTFISILSASSHEGMLDHGWQYFGSLSQDVSLSLTRNHFLCLIDLFGRAGQLDEMEDLINNMPFEPDAVAWMTFLGACKVHGDPVRAVRAAEQAVLLDPSMDAPYVLLHNISITK